MLRRNRGNPDLAAQAMHMTPFVVRQWSRFSITVSLLLCAAAAPVHAEMSLPTGLTPDQQAIIEKVAKPTGLADRLRYAGAPTDPIGAEVRLPLGDGRHLTMIRTGSTVLKDGSIAWQGEVQETGERAVLMLWSNALLTGYFAYDGKIYTVESLGGGVHAFAEMDRHRATCRSSHPSAGGTACRCQLRAQQAVPPPPPAEPTVAPFSDAERQALEDKSVTIDVMVLYTATPPSTMSAIPPTLLALAIEETNETFRNSGLGNISLRLVHSQLIDYDGYRRRPVHPPLRHGRRPWPLQGRQEATRRETGRHCWSHYRQSDRLRSLNAHWAGRQTRLSSSCITPAPRSPCRSRTRSATFWERAMIASSMTTTRRLPMGTAMSTAANGATS